MFVLVRNHLKENESKPLGRGGQAKADTEKQQQQKNISNNDKVKGVKANLAKVRRQCCHAKVLRPKQFIQSSLAKKLSE